MAKPIQLTTEQLELASKLTTLQRKFVIHLVGSSMSQREAYLAAGGKAKTEAAQDTNASRMLSDAKVRSLYNSLLTKGLSSAVMSREEALERLTVTARVTITDVCDFRNVLISEPGAEEDVYQTVWTVKNSADMDPNVAACIKSVTITKTGPKLELHDQTAAIKQLRDMEGWDQPKKAELTGKNGAPLEINSNISAPEVAAALKDLMGML